jgi:N-acetylmuramoyl-L-alanine amidase
MKFYKIFILIASFSITQNAFPKLNNTKSSLSSINISNDDQKEQQSAKDETDNKLKGAIIYLISGHGGPDPGAVATINGNKISEDEYAYDICLRIEKYIKQHNGTAYMIIKDDNNSIRDEKYLKMDYTEKCYPNLTIPRNQTERLQQRVDAVNKLYLKNKSTKYQIALDIHLDSRSNSEKVDVFFYHCKNSKKGKKLAENIHSVFSNQYNKHQPNRGYEGTVSERNLFFIKKVTPPAILIELGNIQNTKDQKRFLQKDNRDAIAKWICEGIIKDFEDK